MTSPRASSSATTLDTFRTDDEQEYIDHLLILYASETGNAQDTAERVGREVRRRGRKCVVTSMDMFDVMQLPYTPLVVFITSTHGRGDPPPAMLPLWTALLRKSLPPDILEGVNFALFGLGDSSYERFAYAGKLLHRRLLALGGEPLLEPAWGDERAPDGIEQTFLPWLTELMDAVTPHLAPPGSGFVERANTELGEPIYRLEMLESNRSSRENGVANGHVFVDGEEHLSSRLNGVCMNGQEHMETAPIREIDAVEDSAHDKWKPDDWKWAVMKRNERVTAEGWWQDVREIELEFLDPDISAYAPGSIANIQPALLPEEVDDFLESQDLVDVADESLRISSTAAGQDLPAHLPPANLTTTLRQLLTHHLDLRASPRKSFFEWLRRSSSEEREQERLDEFLADPDEIHDYATRPSRTILETLGDFRNVRLPLSHLLEILPPLRRRQFSIASSWDLLIAMVEYKTNLSIPRRGLCSSWLKALPIGTKIPIKISPPTLYLPRDPGAPVILVGPGTGVAPMRAFLEERVRQGAAKDTVLYFGCRSRSSDLYYAEEWEKYRTLGASIRTAFSRDSDEKIYVQDLIRKDKDRIRDWLYHKNGHIYICGSSNAMPKAVREAIAWCLSLDAGGDLNEEDATEYVQAMFDDGRGGEESW